VTLRASFAPLQNESKQARSSVVEHYLDTVGVVGSIPIAPTTFDVPCMQATLLMKHAAGFCCLFAARFRGGARGQGRRQGGQPGRQERVWWGSDEPPPPEVTRSAGPKGLSRCPAYPGKAKMATGRPRFDNRQNQRGPQIRINARIRVPEVRVVGADGAMLGIMSTHEALSMAQQQGLDLVEGEPEGDASGVQDPRFWQVQVRDRQAGSGGPAQADGHRHQRGQAPAQDRRPRPQLQEQGRAALHRVREQGEIHGALPRP
jgi:hypothetical protein